DQGQTDNGNVETWTDNGDEDWITYGEDGNEISASGSVTTPNGAGTLEFGVVDQSASEMPSLAQQVTFTNTGSQTLNFQTITPTDFYAEDVQTPLEPGQSVTVNIYPRDNLSAGVHEETIAYTTQEGVEFAFVANVEIAEQSIEIPAEPTEEPTESTDEYVEIPVESTEEPAESEDEYIEIPVEPTEAPEVEEPEPTEEPAEPTEAPVQEEVSGTVTTPNGLGVVDFETVEEGSDTTTVAQSVTLTNTGNVALNFNICSPESFYVDDTTTLNPGESVDLKIYPRSGLGEGFYSETIVYTTQEGFEFKYDATVEITSAENPNPVEETPTPTPEETPEPAEETPTPTPEETPEPVEETPTPTPEETPTPIPTVTPVEETPTPTPTSEITIEPDPVYQLQISAYTLDFGVSTVGYTEAPAAQTVTITNTGDEVTLKNLSSQYFEVSGFSNNVLAPNATATFTVRPKTGLPVSGYSDILKLKSEDGKDLGNVTAVFRVKSATIYSMFVSPNSVAFGSMQTGYTSAPLSQNIIIHNNGTDTIHLQQPTSGYYTVSRLSTYTLKANSTASFSIRPRTGLPAGNYHETITIPNAEGVQASVTADFMVTNKSVVLTSIAQPSPVTGLANGTEKTVEALRLPSTVVINTTAGRMRAGVTWNVAGCSYDPKVTAEQKFTVNGTVTLPAGVTNPNGIALKTSINVAVNAKNAQIANPDYNQISGITPGSRFTLGSKITFTAIGAGMQNQKPGKGDVRYLPVKWNVVEDRTWASAPYTGTFRIGQAGAYKLKVMFSKQEFDGSTWQTAKETDIKSVDFIVEDGANTPTPTPGGRHAVETGDNTVILPYIIVLIIALGAIAGVVVYLKKRKK
ncbi:MAG: choice-of-anchor D domain-containing protein, partial [Eubacteriales bacterium]|nr:choice-of-anchor D domain-containing protein [Eubacteriales bacterium]